MFELHPLRATSKGPGPRLAIWRPGASGRRPRSGTLRLVDPRTNRLGHPVALGDNGVLGGPTAMVLPRDSSVVAAGPTDPTVTVTFSVRLKRKAAGRTFLVEVLATDDVGRRQGFDLAGRLTVSR